MDFAADAVLDVVAPPRQAAGKSAPAADPDAPSFDDHLNAASEDEAPSEDASGQAPAQSADSEVQANASDTDSIVTGDAPDGPTAIAPPTPPASSLPLLVQLIANEAPANTVAQAAPTGDAQTPAIAPAQAAPATPAAPHAPQAPATPDTPTNANGAGQDTAANNATPQATPQQSGQAPAANTQAPPVVTAQQAAATPAQTIAETPIATTPAQLPATNAAATPASHDAAAAPRVGKSNSAPTDDKGAPQDGRAAPSAAPTQAASKVGAKTAPAAAAKDAFTPSLDAATPTQQASAAATASATQGAAHTQHAALDQAATRAAPAAHQVAREIVRQFNGDSTRFELRLDPPELGRVEVRLEVSRDHRVTAVIAADSPQALTELARHARELEQMLQSAGLELGDSGLSFDLRQGGEGADTGENAGSAFGEASSDSNLEQTAPQARPLGFERWRGVRVDVMV